MYRKMLDVIEDVQTRVAERDELIELIAIALLTRKNLFILGDTGQAKSYVINEFRRRITDARQFERLLSKQTDEEALFGRIDLQSLINGTPRMVTTGKIPDSHIVFLDEIYKSNEAVLNSLLTALNERRYTNEGETVDIPTISFFSASNEIPNFKDPAEKILLPLYDRFELKVLTRYIQDRSRRLAIMNRKQSMAHDGIRASLTLDELQAMQGEVGAIHVPQKINELMDDILCDLREQGLHISDRKYYGYYPLAQAKAYLGGRQSIEPIDLLVLKHYLWTTPEQIDTVEHTLTKHCINPLDEKVADIMAMANESMAEWAQNGKERLALRTLKEEFLRLYDMLMDLDTPDISAGGKDLLTHCNDNLNELLRTAYDACSMTFVPLDELKLLA